MATFIVVEGFAPYDGRYELDWDFTTRQYGWVKRLAGLTVDEMIDTIEHGKADAELATVWALVALHQAGKIDKYDVPDLWDRLVDEPFGAKLTIEATKDPEEDAGEGDDGPPLRSSEENEGSSGPDSTTSSETSEPSTPNGSGTPESGISESDRLRSVS